MHKPDYLVFHAISDSSFTLHHSPGGRNGLTYKYIFTKYVTLSVNKRVSCLEDEFISAGDFLIISNHSKAGYTNSSGKFTVRSISQPDEKCYFCDEDSCVWKVIKPKYKGGSWGIGCPQDPNGLNYTDLGHSIQNVFVLEK